MAVKEQLWDFLCNLSPWKDNEVDAVARLEENITTLDVRRTGIYESIIGLERIADDYLREGRDATTQGKTLTAKRLASQLANVRRDLGRQNVVANMHSQKIRILSTNIHNMKLIQEAKYLELPTDQSLTDTFARAEEEVDNLDTLATMAEGMDAGVGMDIADDELAILREFGGEVAESIPEKVPVAVEVIAPAVEMPVREQAERIPEADKG